jgi:hypothetical protein
VVRKIFLFIILSVVLLSPSVLCDYLFNVEVQETHLWIKKDGSAEIWYYIVFKNDRNGKTIDIVDIGLPNDSYDLESAKATVNGYPAYLIKKSEYIPIGVEVHLGAYSIPPGQRGELRFQINQKEMVFTDDQDENYASVEFITNFFGAAYVTGRSDIDVFFHFPSGVKSEEPRYHKEKFTSAGVDKNELVFYRWQIKDGDISLAYRFGASFPKKYMNEGAVKKVTILSRIGLFFGNIFRNIFPTPLLVPCIIPWGLIIFFVIVGIMSGRKRRFQYFKPELSAKGVGIKRGLTAVQAAVLLERPLDKVLAMIVFGLLRKGYLQVKTQKPFAVAKIDVKEAVYHKYEQGFFDSLNAEGVPDRLKLKTCMVDLVKDVQTLMKGFNLYQTRKYYEEIVDTAWKHVKNADLDSSIDWVMVDKDFDKHFEDRLPTDRSIPTPTWYPYYYSGYYGRPYSTGGGGGGGIGGGSGVGKATLSLKQFSNTVASSFENVSHNVVSAADTFTASVTTVTNPVPVSTTSKSGWSSGGGSSCACACACAGCACACAGGGR